MDKEKTFEQECFDFNHNRSIEERCEIIRRTAITNDMTIKERFAVQCRRHGLQFLILCFAALALASCQNMGTRSFGGSSEIHLEKGQRLLEITWKNSDLWILTEPMDSSYIPKVKKFYEKSDLGVLEGTITIYESK